MRLIVFVCARRLPSDKRQGHSVIDHSRDCIGVDQARCPESQSPEGSRLLTVGPPIEALPENRRNGTNSSTIPRGGAETWLNWPTDAKSEQMKIGVFSAFMSPLTTPKMIRDFGRRAEDIGLEAIWMGEHVAWFDKITYGYPGSKHAPRGSPKPKPSIPISC